MDIKILVNEFIEEGEKLIKALDCNQLNITTAFWFYSEEAGEYELKLASPLYDDDDKGPRYLYKKIREILAKMEQPKLDLQNTSVISPNKLIVKALNSKIKANDLNQGIRYTETVIDRVYFDDIYVYRTDYDEKLEEALDTNLVRNR